MSANAAAAPRLCGTCRVPLICFLFSVDYLLLVVHSRAGGPKLGSRRQIDVIAETRLVFLFIIPIMTIHISIHLVANCTPIQILFLIFYVKFFCYPCLDNPKLGYVSAVMSSFLLHHIIMAQINFSSIAWEIIT